ncbi:hypothetical protein N9C62_07980 [Luminiphilus sp.]|nr:hypothetical protein [Luminiphilus sp.]
MESCATGVVDPAPVAAAVEPVPSTRAGKVEVVAVSEDANRSVWPL